MKKFAIVSLPRTGTTMLSIALNNVNGFNVFGEILTNKFDHTKIKIHPQEAIENFKKKSQASNLWHFLSAKRNIKDKEIPLKTISKKDVYSFLDNIYNKEGEYVGFKLLFPHIKRLPYVADYLKDKNIYIIHLYRENKLDQILSALTNQHMHFGKGKMTINRYDNIPEKIETNTANDRKLSKMFSNSIDISYEEMTNNENIEKLNVKKIWDFLEVKGDPIIPILTKKYGPSMKDRITNYDEIIEYLRRYYECC